MLKLLPKRNCDDFLNSHRSPHPSFLMRATEIEESAIRICRAWQVYSQHSFGLLLRKNGMHRTQSNGMCVLTFYMMNLRNSPASNTSNRVLTFDQKPVIPAPHSLIVIGYYWCFLFLKLIISIKFLLEFSCGR